MYPGMAFSVPIELLDRGLSCSRVDQKEVLRMRAAIPWRIAAPGLDPVVSMHRMNGHLLPTNTVPATP